MVQMNQDDWCDVSVRELQRQMTSLRDDFEKQRQRNAAILHQQVIINRCNLNDVSLIAFVE